MGINDIQKKINSINWNFDFTIHYGCEMIRPFNCRKYYSYPATFIPEIPYSLIEILSKRGDKVLDPFGGIGTTFMQALCLERIPFSFDINPIATNICNAFFKLFDPRICHKKIADQLLNLCKEFNESENYCNLITTYHNELKDWYEDHTFKQLAYLFNIYKQIDDEYLRVILGLILPSILTTLSSQNKGWAYIADNVKPKRDELRQKNVFDQYKSTVNILLNDIKNQISNLPKSYLDFYKNITKEPCIFDKSLLESSLEKESIDLIITSPPYPRMIDYIKSQRLSFYFFEMNFKDYIEKETGARHRRTRQDAQIKYEEQIGAVNKIMFELLKSNGFLCLILPDYDIKDNRKDSIDKIVKSYTESKLKLISKIGRYIPSHKRTLSIQWASLVNEHIYIFQKG